MKIHIEFDPTEPKTDDLLRFLGDCVAEWQKPEVEEPITTRKCEKCGCYKPAATTRGRFICTTCRESADK